MDAISRDASPFCVPGNWEGLRLLTLQEAAIAVGARYWQLQRAVKRGDIPSYSPFNSRKLVKLSEVVAYIDATRQGGVL